MPSRSQFAGPLADRLDRLRSAFAALHRSVRDRVAEIVGTTVADVARQAVRAALDPPAPVAPARGGSSAATSTTGTTRGAGPSPTGGPATATRSTTPGMTPGPTTSWVRVPRRWRHRRSHLSRR